MNQIKEKITEICKKKKKQTNPETKQKDYLTIDDLLQKKFEKHVAPFEIPDSVKSILDIDMINAIITWYLNWKLTTPIEQQNTCTIRDIFGQNEAIKVVVAINFYKYLRNKSYDPNIIEIFLKQ